MSDFMKFDSGILDQEVSIEFNATIKDVVSILSVIGAIQLEGYDEDGSLSNIYDQIFEQIMSYGSLIDGDDNDD